MQPHNVFSKTVHYTESNRLGDRTRRYRDRGLLFRLEGEKTNGTNKGESYKILPDCRNLIPDSGTLQWLDHF